MLGLPDSSPWLSVFDATRMYIGIASRADRENDTPHRCAVPICVNSFAEFEPQGLDDDSIFERPDAAGRDKIERPVFKADTAALYRHFFLRASAYVLGFFGPKNLAMKSDSDPLPLLRGCVVIDFVGVIAVLYFEARTT